MKMEFSIFMRHPVQLTVCSASFYHSFDSALTLHYAINDATS